MKIDGAVAYFPFTKVETLDFDYGREVAIYRGNTPIGAYTYYRVPRYVEGEDTENREGQIALYGPSYGDPDFDSEGSPIAWCDTAVTAQRIAHADMVERIKQCFKTD